MIIKTNFKVEYTKDGRAFVTVKGNELINIMWHIH